MALIKYADLINHCKIESYETVEVAVGDTTILVQKNLKIADQYEFIDFILRKSWNGSIYNEFLMDTYSILGIVYLYSNIVFSPEDRADEFDLLDKLNRAGIAEAILSNVDYEEVNRLLETAKVIAKSFMKYGNSFGVMMRQLAEELPQQLEQFSDYLKNFNPEKIQEMLMMAQTKATE